MSDGELPARRFRRTVPGEIVTAAIMMVLALPLTVVGLLQAAPEPLSPGQFTWLISLLVLLHVTGFFCSGRPIAAFVGGSALMLLLAFTIVPGIGSAALLPSSVAYLLLLWRLASSPNRRHSFGALTTGLIGVGVITAVSAVQASLSDRMTLVFEAVSLVAAVLAAWALGALARQSRLAEYRRAQESMQHAVSEERARISRDLHDVVSHSLTVMIAQAEAARVVAGSSVSRNSPEADAAFERVAETGREAMRGLRSMIHTLGDPDASPLAPVSGVDAIAGLVEHASSAEHTIELTVEGAPRRLAPDADLAAFRIVQEAVTNAIRHLRPPTRIDVSLDWQETETVITVSDDGGQGPLRRAADSNGTGLIGLVERVRRAGGALYVRRGHGWRVRATLPVEEPS